VRLLSSLAGRRGHPLEQAGAQHRQRGAPARQLMYVLSLPAYDDMPNSGWSQCVIIRVSECPGQSSLSRPSSHGIVPDYQIRTDHSIWGRLAQHSLCIIVLSALPRHIFIATFRRLPEVHSVVNSTTCHYEGGLHQHAWPPFRHQDLRHLVSDAALLAQTTPCIRTDDHRRMQASCTV